VEFDLWLEAETVEARNCSALAGWHAGHCGEGGEGRCRRRGRAVLTDGEKPRPTNGPAPGGRFPARGTERDRGNYRCEGRRVPQPWRPLNHAGLCHTGQLAQFVEARDRRCRTAVEVAALIGGETPTSPSDHRCNARTRESLSAGEPCLESHTTRQRLLHTFDYWRSCKSAANPAHPVQ
jgi:hypothetical protein